MTQNEFRRKRNALRRQVRSARLDAKRRGVFQGVYRVTGFGPGRILGWVDPDGSFRTTVGSLYATSLRVTAGLPRHTVAELMKALRVRGLDDKVLP
jgi:hypothetical protein